ncbi:MAG: AIR carboxylase family protein, partial [Clostridia bacterium]|nr:AIR carboxylase family protein [Clostridia bacterium]
IPVATVAIDGAENAGILAAQILALKYDNIAKLLIKHKEDMANEVNEKNRKLKEELK